jgi:ribonuclease T2
MWRLVLMLALILALPILGPILGPLLGPGLAISPRAQAQNQGHAGEFDYYVLSLSWNAAWCEAEGAGRGAEQCDPDRDIGFILHGLWPQYRNGWPEYCETPEPDPSRAETAAMADIMGSGGLAWHEWKKHGRCSGLSSAQYFALSREAWESIRRPEVLRRIRFPRRVAPAAIEAAFIEANQLLQPDGVTVTCKDRRFREVRICLTKDLLPRPCTGTTARDCTMSGPLFAPMR